jgi:hypothetical protein
MTRTWFDDEPPLTSAFEQVRHLILAGLERKRVALAAGMLVAALIAACVLWTKYSYAPQYVLRVVEADRSATGVPRPYEQLAEYVREAVFTSGPLLDVMSRHGLYPDLSRKNPRAALESFREDIDLDVRQNYFVEARPTGAAPRSVLLSLSYRNADPSVAMSVTRELGELVIGHEQATREGEATRAADLAQARVDDARTALAIRRAAVASMRSDMERGGVAGFDRQILFIGLLGSIPALELQQDERERRAASLALGATLERRKIGTLFEVVNDAVLPADGGLKSTRWLAAGATLVLALPLIAMAIGAFAPRRHSA